MNRDELVDKLNQIRNYQNVKQSNIYIEKVSEYDNHITIVISTRKSYNSIDTSWTCTLQYNFIDDTATLKIFGREILELENISIDELNERFLNTKFLRKILKALKTVLSNSVSNILKVTCDEDTLDININIDYNIKVFRSVKI